MLVAVMLVTVLHSNYPFPWSPSAVFHQLHHGRKTTHRPASRDPGIGDPRRPLQPPTAASSEDELPPRTVGIYSASMVAEQHRYGRGAAGVYAWLIDPLVKRLRPRIALLCKERGAKDVLDIACATGAQCRALARVGIVATGVDQSEAMIAAAQRRTRLPSTFLIGSAFDLPFEAGAFDAAILSLALHEHPEHERTRMIEEARRVVGSAGALVIADYTRPRCWPFSPPWGIIRLIENVAGRQHRAGFRDFVARGSLNGLLARHGLQPLTTRRSHFGTIGVSWCGPVDDS